MNIRIKVIELIFEIIGEAAGRVPATMVKDSPIAWNKITGLRQKLIHDYFGVDIEIVWKTAKTSIQPLKAFIEQKLKYL